MVYSKILSLGMGFPDILPDNDERMKDTIASTSLIIIFYSATQISAVLSLTQKLLEVGLTI